MVFVGERVGDEREREHGNGVPQGSVIRYQPLQQQEWASI